MEKFTFRTLYLVFLLISTTAFSQGETIIGEVLYHTNYPMSGVNAYLHSPQGNIIDTAVTNNEGNYQFYIETPGNYTITFTTDQPEGGVELGDAFLVMAKLLNLTYLDPVQTLAADVNGSGNITWGDYILILISYLNQGNPFQEPWVFETVSVTIPSGSRSVYTTGGGSSSGDVNGSLQPDKKNNLIFLNNPVVDLTTNSSEPVNFNLSCGQDLQIAGMHLVIRIPDDLNLIDVKSAIPAANINISDGQIKVTWIDETLQGVELTEGTSLLVIRTKATRQSRNGNSYSLKLSDESHFINTDGILIPGVCLILPTINLKMQEDLTHSAYPNPFLNDATIGYYLPQEAHVIMVLFDQSGKQVQVMENGVRSSGIHQAKINGSSLLPGTYHYSIRISNSGQYIGAGTIIKSR